MRTFLETFWLSMTEPSIYRQLSAKSFKQSLGYFLGWYAVFSMVASLLIVVFLLPQGIATSKQLLDDAAAGFPDEAVVQVTNGELSLLDSASPLQIPLSDAMGLDLDYLTTIDPEASAESIRERKTLLMMTRSAFAVVNAASPEGFQVFRWDQLGTDFRVDKPMLQSEVETLKRDVDRMRPWAFPILSMVLFAVLTVGRLIMIGFNAVFINVIAILLGRGQSYQRAAIIGLHTMVIAEVINMVQIVVYAGAFPSLITYAFLAISTVAVLALPKRPRLTLTNM